MDPNQSEQNLRVLEGRILRRIFCATKDLLTQQWTILSNEEFFHRYQEPHTIAGVANLRLASHMRLFEGLSWLLINVPEFPFIFVLLHFKTLLSFRMRFKMSFKLLTTNMKE